MNQQDPIGASTGAGMEPQTGEPFILHGPRPAVTRVSRRAVMLAAVFGAAMTKGHHVGRRILSPSKTQSEEHLVSLPINPRFLPCRFPRDRERKKGILGAVRRRSDRNICS